MSRLWEYRRSRYNPEMAGSELPPEFGTLVVGVENVLRPGGYAVIRRATGEIAVVTTPGGCFLPGGGLQQGETPEQAAIRETREESGLRIRIGFLIGVANQLVYSADEATHFRKQCLFYLSEVIASEGDGGEADHVLSWLMPEAAARQLSHESQRWAVAEVCQVVHRGIPHEVR